MGDLQVVSGVEVEAGAKHLSLCGSVLGMSEVSLGTKKKKKKKNESLRVDDVAGGRIQHSSIFRLPQQGWSSVWQEQGTLRKQQKCKQAALGR